MIRKIQGKSKFSRNHHLNSDGKLTTPMIGVALFNN